MIVCPRLVQALASCQCWPPPRAGDADGSVMAPAEARREAQSTRQSPSAKTEAVEDLALACSSKSKIPPELESNLLCIIEAQSSRRGPKQVWMPQAQIEARSARRGLKSK